MAGLTIQKLIKIIIGVFVVAAVVTALYFAFENQVFDFFRNVSSSV